MSYQIRRMWGGVVPILTANLPVDATFNHELTRAAIEAFDQYTSSASSSASSDCSSAVNTSVSNEASAGRRRRRRSQGSSARNARSGGLPATSNAAESSNTITSDALTPNDHFFEHQRTRGYRLATPSIFSCQQAKQLEEKYIVDAISYYLKNAFQHHTLANQLVLSGGGGEFSIDMWAAVQRGVGAYHKDHTHDGAIVSGVYYSAVPPGSSPLVLRRPGDQYLHRLRQEADADGRSEITFKEEVGGDVFVDPKERLLVLFPPWLHHGVPVAKVAQGSESRARVSFAFNLTGRLAALGNPWDITRPPHTS